MQAIAPSANSSIPTTDLMSVQSRRLCKLLDAVWWFRSFRQRRIRCPQMQLRQDFQVGVVPELEERGWRSIREFVATMRPAQHRIRRPRLHWPLEMQHLRKPGVEASALPHLRRLRHHHAAERLWVAARARHDPGDLAAAWAKKLCGMPRRAASTTRWPNCASAAPACPSASGSRPTSPSAATGCATTTISAAGCPSAPGGSRRPARPSWAGE